jgi:hypothetical protein
MAFNNSILEKTVRGNHQVQVYSCVADGATGTIVTGFNSVVDFSMVSKSLTTGAVKFGRNALVSGTFTGGTIAVTGATSGDEFYLTVYGR